MQFTVNGIDTGRIVATFTLLNDAEKVENLVRPLKEKLKDELDVIKQFDMMYMDKPDW